MALTFNEVTNLYIYNFTNLLYLALYVYIYADFAPDDNKGEMKLVYPLIRQFMYSPKFKIDINDKQYTLDEIITIVKKYEAKREADRIRKRKNK